MVKNLSKRLIIALAAVITFSMAGCDNGTTTNNNIPVTLNSVTANGGSTQTTTELTLTFNAAINDLSADDITLSGVEGVNKGTLSGTGSTYTLPISGFTKGGTLSVAAVKTGYDISGSPKTVAIFYNSGGGDTDVTFSGLSANGGSTQTTTELTLTFNDVIADLSADDITLGGVAGVNKGTLSGTGPTYTLPISGFTKDGTLNVAVTKSGYNIHGSPKTTAIFYLIPVTLNSVTEDGGGTATTMELTLTFNAAITGLSADDITLSGVDGVNKGTLGGTGSTYTLPISGFTENGILSVTVAKSGYSISGSPKTVTIFYIPIPVTFNSVTGNGSGTAATTRLTLTFNEVIHGLSAEDITLSGVDGVTKGTLSGTGSTYTLPISGFTESGTLNVAVAAWDYIISGSPKTVAIYSVKAGFEVTFTGFGEETITLFPSAAAITAGTTLAVTVTETFDSYEWYLDGLIQSGFANTYSWTVPSSPIFVPYGIHNLTVIVKKGSSYHSKILTFTVVE